MEYELLKDVIILFTLSIVVIYVFHRLKIPPVIGFLLTGILAGPDVFSLVTNQHDIEVLAEIGVILLLFTIGIEFSIKKLLEIKVTVLLGGSLQVFVTAALVWLTASQFGLTTTESIFVGFLVALSSTAIVLKIMQEKGEVTTLHGKITLGILIFQDIIIVPMILITPLMAGTEGNIGMELLYMTLKIIGLGLFMFAFGKWVAPRILFQIAKTQSRELFLLTIIVLGFAVAFLTYSIGLSLALGAFIGGLIISESEFSEEAFGNIIPFRDVFTSFFFVSVGMLLDFDYLLSNPILVLLVTLVVIFLKTFVSGVVAFILGYPFRTTVIVGLTLSQIGEFSFILSKIGRDYGIFALDNYQLFLSVTVLTIAVTPFIINAAPMLADRILSYPIPRKIKCGLQNIPEQVEERKKDHLIIVGYGINGKNVARAAKYANIPHVIIELNPETVKSEQARGETIYYGDATQDEILEHANIQEALILVVTIPSPLDARRITATARRLNPKTHIIIRTRFIQDMKKLLELGADEVIPEEFETSIEIFTRVLSKYLVPRDKIESFVNDVRSDGYGMFRSLSTQSPGAYKNLSVKTPQTEINTIRVCRNSSAAGKNITQAGITKEKGLKLLALSRDGKILSDMENDFVLRENDVLFLLGNPANFNSIIGYFKDADEEGAKDCNIA
ncbi:MAG: cation:proton antiporter [Bacteroidales bacterium]|nr:cation:proton antiporter [Bacteroidales bacterium]MCF8388171.1 cation:proton antiporter [Bacteroidales bacterium]MCF8399099.1 cation:proton antiporter [Bacteroidales bacterium]